MSKGLLIDVTKCIGCGSCSDACQKANGLPDSPDGELSDKRYTVVQEVQVSKAEPHYIRRLCMHCQHPTCESVCPVGAFKKTAEGPVLYEAGKCMGCRYCMMACPYGVPRYEWSSTNPRVRKCIMCAPRLRQGLPTACAEACPTGATMFGDRDELLQEAHNRVREQPDLYVPVDLRRGRRGWNLGSHLGGRPLRRAGLAGESTEPPDGRVHRGGAHQVAERGGGRWESAARAFTGSSIGG